MVINVTKNDIWAGLERDGRWCPVALALKRAIARAGLPKVESVRVGTTHLRWFSKDHESIETEIPERISDWIDAFDTGCNVGPVRFGLEVPDALA